MLRPASKFRVAGFRPRAPNGRQSHPQIPRCWPSACPERLGAINLPTQGNLVAANARHDMTCTLFFSLTPSLHRADSELRWRHMASCRTVLCRAVPCHAMPCHAQLHPSPCLIPRAPVSPPGPPPRPAPFGSSCPSATSCNQVLHLLHPARATCASPPNQQLHRPPFYLVDT